MSRLSEDAIALVVIGLIVLGAVVALGWWMGTRIAA
jgi:hypothetical protein